MFAGVSAPSTYNGFSVALHIAMLIGIASAFAFARTENEIEEDIKFLSQNTLPGSSNVSRLRAPLLADLRATVTVRIHSGLNVVDVTVVGSLNSRINSQRSSEQMIKT